MHRTPQHPHILLHVRGIERSPCSVPEQGFVANTLILSHVVDSYARINGFVDQSDVATRPFVHHQGAVTRRVLSPKLGGGREGEYGFRRGLGSNSFVLACQRRSSMMILRHTDVPTTDADYIIVGRTETPVAMEKLETALGKKLARGKSQYSSQLQK